MDFKKIIDRTNEVWRYYIDSDKRRLGKEWHRGEYVKALVADVGALVKYAMAKDGLREVENVDQKLKHEIGDILSCLIIIAQKYDVDIENAFFETMDELEDRGKKMELHKSHTL
ncbi:MAG: MazG nucleotide pyrophosphohydrolase domain-containing protein [bacterium]